MDCITIKKARYIQEYQLWLEFNTGEAGKVDLKDFIYKFPAAAPLRNQEEFAKFRLDEWPTLVWDCGFDADPEYLYTLATGKPTYESVIDNQPSKTHA